MAAFGHAKVRILWRGRPTGRCRGRGLEAVLNSMVGLSMANCNKFGSAGSPRVRWQMRHERPRATRALRWGAPPTADPPRPGPEKHQKSFRRVGESFLDGIRVAHKRLQEHSPPPSVLRVPKIGKKRRFDAFFGRFFAFRKAQNAVNYSIFAFYRLLREPCKNAENAVNTNTF